VSKYSVTSYFLYSPYQFVESNFLLLVMSAKAEKRVLNTNILVQPRRWKGLCRDQVVEVLLWISFVGTLILIFGPALVSHVQRAAEPLIFNDDARAWIYPFYRYSESALFPNDYNGDYHLAISPWGYRGLYMIASYFGVATELSKIVPYVGLLSTVTCLAITAYAFGGKTGAWVAAALCLGNSIYLANMSGGLARSFAFPLLAAAGAALTYSRYHIVGILVLLGAAFYPVTAVQIGIALALVLLVLPANSRGGVATGWSFKRCLIFVAAIGGTAVLVLLPHALSSSRFGDVIRPSQVDEFPEAGPGGRYGNGDRPPFASFFETAPRIAGESILGGGDPWFKSAHTWAVAGQHMKWVLSAIMIFALGGWVCLAWKQPNSRRLLMLGVAAIIGHTIAIAIAPLFYLPSRYVVFSVPILTTVMVATGAAGYLTVLRSRVRGRYALSFAIALAAAPLFACIGGRGSRVAGLNIDQRQSKGFYAELVALPKYAMIAGWPSGVLNNIPYVARRQVLLNFECHQIFHVEYALEMRRRTEARIVAYFANSPGPLEALRDKYRFTHLLIDLEHFQGKPPQYFKPFDELIKRVTAQHEGGGGYEVLRQAEHGIRMHDGHHVLIELDHVRSPYLHRLAASF